MKESTETWEGARRNSCEPTQEVIGQAQAGNDSAKAKIATWFIYHEHFFRCARRILSNPEDATDAVYDAALKIFESLSTYDSTKGSFAGWCYKIVEHTALDRLRKRQKVEVVQIEAGGDVPLVANSHGDLESGELSKILESSALAACSATEYEVFMLWKAGYTNREIAVSVFDTEDETKRVENLKHKAKRKIKDYITLRQPSVVLEYRLAV
jgi:RNA polymerase sigma factor (sigma-70 family)